MRHRACHFFAFAISAVAATGMTATAWAGAPGQGTVDAGAALAEAQVLIKDGKNEQAIALLQRTVQAAPTLTEGWVQLGNTQLSLGRTNQAIRSYEQALKLDAGLQDVRYNLAYAYRQTGQFNQAVNAYRAYLKGSPKDADALFGLAESYKGDEQWAAAADAFDTYAAAEIRPDQAQWAAKAREEAQALRAKAGVTASAAAAAPSAAPATGGVSAATAAQAPAPSVAAGSASVSGAMVSPVAETEAADTSAPTEASPVADGDPAAIDQSLAVDAETADLGVMPARPLSFQEGLKYLRAGDYARALRQLRAAAEKVRDDPVVLSALASAYLGNEDGQEALDTYRRAMALEPSASIIPALQFGIAEALRLLRDDSAAVVALRQVLADEATPDTLRALANERLAALSP